MNSQSIKVQTIQRGQRNDYAFRIAVIDTLDERIYLYDGDDARIEIFCNASENSIKVPINEPPKEAKPLMTVCRALRRKAFGTPEGTRTPAPLLRRQMLYPAELPARIW